MKQFKDCKIPFIPVSALHLYCRKCRLLRDFQRRQAYFASKKSQPEPLGTTDFGEHREKNFEREAAAVAKEFTRLNLKRRK